MFNSGECSLMKEIKAVEENINTCYERVLEIRAKLNKGELNEERKEVLRQELQEVEKLLSTNKGILKQLHKNNRQTFFFVAALILLIFIIWMLFYLLFGDEKF